MKNKICDKCGGQIKKGTNFLHLFEASMNEMPMAIDPREVKSLAVGYLCESCADAEEGIN